MASSSVKSSFSRADFAESQPSQWSKKQGRAVLRTRILNNSRRVGLCLVGKHNLDNELPFPNSGKVSIADHPSKTLIFPCCNRLFHLLASVASAWIKAVSREIVVSGLRQRFWARERIGV